MPLVTVLTLALTAVLGIISLAELYCYYADLPYNKVDHNPILWRLIIRRSFYAIYFISIFLALSYLFVLLTWTFIGLLFKAAEYISYVVGVVMVGASIGRYFLAVNAVQKRVVKAVTEKLEILSQTMLACSQAQPVRGLFGWSEGQHMAHWLM